MRYRNRSHGYFGFHLRVGSALAVALTFVAFASPGRVLAGDRFKATIADGGAGEAGEMRTPLEFERGAIDHPQTGSQSLFSRCRRPPFSSTVALYNPLTAPEFDAIVGDTAAMAPSREPRFLNTMPLCHPR